MALSKDVIAENEGVHSKKTPRKVGEGLKLRGIEQKEVRLEVNLMGINRRESSHLIRIEKKTPMIQSNQNSLYGSCSTKDQGGGGPDC